MAQLWNVHFGEGAGGVTFVGVLDGVRVRRDGMDSDAVVVVKTRDVFWLIAGSRLLCRFDRDGVDLRWIEWGEVEQAAGCRVAVGLRGAVEFESLGEVERFAAGVKAGASGVLLLA